MMQRDKNRMGWWQGLIYGLAPHTFCILFIVFSALGATAATSLLRDLFYLPHFIELVVGLGFLFATISALFYLRKNGLLSWAGVRFKRNYLLLMYATTIAVNLLFFRVIFPAVANLDLTTVRAGNSAAQLPGGQATQVTLQVEIPCAGHAPLVISELRKVSGVLATRYRDPDLFDVSYDPARVSLEEILAQSVFASFAARAVAP